MSARVDPATLSQEIDETRADVGETLDALQAKLSPGQLLDQAVTFCSERGYQLTRRLGQTIREHPVPTALAGAGLLWYLSARRRHEDELYADEAFAVDGDYDDLEVEDASPGTGEKLKSAAASLRRRGSGAASMIKERASGATSTIKERAGRASGAVRQGAHRAGEGFSHLVHEQPLLLGAVGVAIGAAIAALLPSSETEDQLLGEASDRAYDRAKQKGGEQYEKVRETIKRAAEGAQRAASSDPGSASYPGAS